MYRNFICYRGGSSGGINLGEDIYKVAKTQENIIGKTYYSLYIEDAEEIRNFKNDPAKHISTTENFVMLLTKDFFSGFIKNNEPNKESITRIEIDEALKNPNLRFIPVMYPDFNWDGITEGRVNKEILVELWGIEAADRIVGSLPIIPYSFIHKDSTIENIIRVLDNTGKLKDFKISTFDGTYKLCSTPSIFTKNVFCGRERELAQIDEYFNNGERLIFLQGIGGIGKTEIAKQYAKRNKDKFDTVIYATYNGSLMELFSSQYSFKIEPEFPRQLLLDGSQESDLSYFHRKLNLLRDITNERTLIIIDNFDVMDDEHFSEILDANYKLLITTRCDHSRLCTTIKIDAIDSIEQLKQVFLENYQGHMVDKDDEHLEELIELVNRHTYTIELIAQHMENSWQTTEEMIDTLKHEGIVSLNEEVRSSMDKSQVAYQNLLRMFKVFNLSDEEKEVLQYLSLMPLTGVKAKDFKDWIGPKALKVIMSLENRSWIFTNSIGIALHPIIREVVRYELPLKDKDATAFFEAFNETIKEQKSWHFSIATKNYYADISTEIITVFKEINEYTAETYRNIELLFSFSVKPAKAVELAAALFEYHKKLSGEESFMCGYCSFQAGWTYLFNLDLPDSIKHSKEWFDISYRILSKVELSSENDFAVYGHLLSHISRTYLIAYGEDKNPENLQKAKKFAMEACENAEKHFGPNSIFYSRIAVGYMQLAEAYIASGEYDKALKLVEDAYSIMVNLFGENDPDTLNVSSRKSAIYYYMGRYDEALAIGQKNVDAYTSFYGELNYFRFEQLVLVYRCLVKQGKDEQAKSVKENVIKIGSQLLSEDSEQLKEFLNS